MHFKTILNNYTINIRIATEEELSYRILSISPSLVDPFLSHWVGV